MVIYVVNKKHTIKNIEKIISEDFCELYTKYATEDLDKEKLSALIFNSVLIACQLLGDEESIKGLIEDFIEKNIRSYDGYLSFYNNPDLFLMEMLSKYSDISYNEVLERLRHGYAVHFTTPKIMEIIKEKEVLSSSNQMFTKEVEELIEEAKKNQYSNTGDVLKCLSTGFGFGQGISMSSQTNGYWMNHTPESLSFLFGGHVYTRDKEAAILHVLEATSSLDFEFQKKILIELNKIWDRLIGEDKNLGAILIDRDGIEYEKVTHWNYDPPKIEEIRPYRYDLNDIISNENSKVYNDINIEYLAFLKVPSIVMLEEYRMNKINTKNK